MSPNPLYHLTVEGTDIIVRLKGDMIDRGKLVRLLDSLEREAIREHCMQREKSSSTIAPRWTFNQRG